MSDCISNILKMFRVIEHDKTTVDAEIPDGKLLKFNDQNIKAENLINIFKDDKLSEAAIDNVSNKMGPLNKKLRSLNNIDVGKLKKFTKFIKDPEKVVSYSIAMKELLDTQKAEYDKFLRQDSKIKVTSISDDGIMNVGLARSAAVIGRKYLYTKGLRIRSNPEEKAYISPSEIEVKEYNLGLSILRDMEKDGLVTLRPEGNVINDFWKDKESGIPTTNIIKMPVALPRLESLLEEKDYTENKEYYKSLLKGELIRRKDDTDKPKTILDLQALVNGINTAKISPMESLPNKEVPTKEKMSKNDAMKMSDTGEKFRKYLASTPVKIHEAMIPMFTDLAQKWKDSKDSFKKFSENLAGGDYSSLQKTFGVYEVEDFAEDLSNSVHGQNKSKLDPLEAFLNNINQFIEGGKSNDIYMNYNIVRNARLNMDNSILNAQAAKLFRNAVISKKTKLKLEKGEEEVVDHFITSIMDRLGDLDIDFKGETGSKELLSELLNGTEDGKLNAALNHLDVLAGRSNKLEYKTDAVISFADKYAKGNITAAIATLDGIKDLRTLMKDGEVETSYNSMSDATASGGTIGLAASLGYNDKTKSIVEKLGLIDGKKGTLDDVYAILSEDLDSITNNKSEENDIYTKKADKKGAEKLPKFLKVVYNNKMRNLSKSPSMTFIYNQGKKGAIKSIALNATETLLKNATDKETLDYINELTGKEYTKDNVLGEEAAGLKKELITALQDKDKSPIPFIHNRLEATVGDLIAKRKTIIQDLYKAVSEKKTGNITMLSPLAFIDHIEDTPKNRMFKSGYGMPLSKVQNILNKKGEKAYVVTMEDRENPTTALVNTTHGQDMAIAALALKWAKEEFKAKYPDEEIPGAVFVHDEVVTSPKLGALVDKAYIKAFKKVVSEFSVEKQLLDQLKELDPKNELINKYEDTILKANAEKQKIIETYNNEPGKIYGNAKGKYNISDEFKFREKNNKSEPKPIHTVEEPKIKSKTLYKQLTILSRKSSLIYGYLKSNPKVLNKWKDDYLYNTNKDQIELGDISPIDYTSRKAGETSDEKLTELIEHEITHAYTAAYIAKELSKPIEDRDVKIQYVEKALGNLPHIKNNSNPDNLNKSFNIFKDENTQERINYILGKETHVEKMAEFIAIMNAEKSVAKDIYAYFRETKETSEGTQTKLEFYIKNIVGYINKLLKNEPLDSVYAPALQKSIENIVTEGKSYKENNYKDAMKTQKKTYGELKAGNTDTIDPYPDNFDPEKNYNKRDATKPEIITGRTLQMMNEVSRNLVIKHLENAGDNLTKSADRFLNANFPMYADVRKRILGLYNESSMSSSLQSIGDFIGATGLHNKATKQDIISTFHNIKETKNEREHKYLKQIKDLTKNFTKEGNKELYDLITKVPLHNYFKFDSELETKKDITNEISNLESKLSKNDNSIVNDTVEFINTSKVQPHSIYNFSDYDINADTTKRMEKLIAFKALMKSGHVDKLFNLKNNNSKLYEVMKDNSLALYTLSNKLHGMSSKGSLATHTLVNEQYKTRNEYKVFELKDRNLYDSGENLGHKIIKEPTKNTLGVVSTRIQDDTFTQGAGVLEDLPGHDITVPKHLAEKYNLVDNNIMTVGDRYKMILSHDEKLKAGILEDMGTTLIKSAANIVAADDSQYIRNKLMEDGLRSVIKSNGDKQAIDDLVFKIKSDLIDHPYVLKLENDVKFDQLPKIIRDKYKPIQQNLSSIGNFKGNITHVRKDIRHWLIGGHVPSLFKNPKLQRMSVLIKEAIAGSKIGMVMVNPKKIVNDLISNNTHLSLLGVNATKIAMYQKDILKDINSLNIIKNGLLEYELKYKAIPTKENKERYEKLKYKMEHHPLYTAHKNAYMSSLSSDILSSDASTTEGLQADIESGIKYLLTDKNGNKNALHKIIGTASRFGYSGTEILRSLGRVTDTMNTDKEISKYLEGVANRIDEIKNDDDMVKYVSQYTTSPDAETVKAGTVANNISDLMMRETYRRYLIDKDVSPAKANEKAIAMAPFYPEDMPLGIKMLSDYFLIPFPSWTLRVHQPVMYIFKNRFGTLATEEIIARLLDKDLEMYAESHPFAKILEGNLLANPLNEVGVQSIIPTNAFNF